MIRSDARVCCAGCYFVKYGVGEVTSANGLQESGRQEVLVERAGRRVGWYHLKGSAGLRKDRGEPHPLKGILVPVLVEEVECFSMPFAVLSLTLSLSNYLLIVTLVRGNYSIHSNHFF